MTTAKPIATCRKKELATSRCAEALIWLWWHADVVADAWDTLPKTNIAFHSTWKHEDPKGKLYSNIFQPSIFSCKLLVSWSLVDLVVFSGRFGNPQATGLPATYAIICIHICLDPAKRPNCWYQHPPLTHAWKNTTISGSLIVTLPET